MSAKEGIIREYSPPAKGSRVPRLSGWTAILLCAAVFGAGPVAVRPVDPGELPAGLQATPSWMAELNRETESRIREGEADHLIFYALQSTSFTALPPIEPTLSARLWHETGRLPEDAAKRLEEFRAAPRKDSRHAYFGRMMAAGFDLNAEYERAMRFLYEKEWASRTRDGADRRAFIAGLYETRGHSTDTSLEANYAVHVSLEALRKSVPGLKIRRALLVGPGLDWAPRMALRNDVPPQSYQPYALADSLLRLGLSDRTTLRIDAADINQRVLDHLAAFPTSARRMWLRYAPGDEPWNNFFDGLGKAIGIRGHEDGGNTLDVSRPASRLVRPLRLNVLTERITPPAQYDLVVATNVLLYFEERELELALANLADALGTGGYLLHNDGRAEVEVQARVVGLPIIGARMVRLDARRGLYDAAILHQRAARTR
jgi:SAM-dependent methyltransferase